jgi:hypothetical protein
MLSSCSSCSQSSGFCARVRLSAADQQQTTHRVARRLSPALLSGRQQQEGFGTACSSSVFPIVQKQLLHSRVLLGMIAAYNQLALLHMLQVP